MDSEGSEKERVMQIIIDGFNNDVTAKVLMDYLEDMVGTVWRCRLKTSSTPQESYPNFNIGTDIQSTNYYQRVKPHAFVHFAGPNSAKLALDAAKHCELKLDNKFLKVSLGPEDPCSMHETKEDN
ncbi:hypothetical protein Vadar_005917 [Vaccinium darrowii]|uniref:Uncharacterized protein n=1 Tax=Vaccinium darrowii TaxID=229202 RepID=A0ACB7ZHT4_9ERIC|nr:hypothetical protein Vadar_005917 [Vaccinium darrowii]